MKKVIIKNNSNLELKNHGTYDFPIRISNGNILDYLNGRFENHWHEEIQLTFIESGEMTYYLNGVEYHLVTGDCLFINSNILHFGHSINNKNCHYQCITFLPEFVMNTNSLVYKRYIAPIIENKSIYGLKLSTKNDLQLNKLLLNIINSLSNKDDFFELELHSNILNLWSTIFKNASKTPYFQNPKYSDNVKKMLTFIHKNYDKKFYLKDLAKYTFLSERTCNYLFKKIMHESPFEYLLRYRINKSKELLIESNFTVTEISYLVGFNSPSYFSKTFKNYYQLSPNEYRKLASTYIDLT